MERKNKQIILNLFSSLICFIKNINIIFQISENQ